MIYLLENIRTAPDKRAEFFAAAEREQLPLYSDLGYRLVVYWETAPFQGYWPEAVALWELDGYGHYSAVCKAEYGDGPLAQRRREWQRRLGALATSSQGRVLIPSSGTPTLAQMRKTGRRAPMAVIETVHTMPGKSRVYVEQMQKLWGPVAEKFGRWMIGTYWAPWNHRVCINIWAAEEWGTVPPGGMFTDTQSVASDAHTWVEVGMALRDEWDDRVVVALPFSSLLAGTT
jgi:hypothetical protein